MSSLDELLYKEKYLKYKKKYIQLKEYQGGSGSGSGFFNKAKASATKVKDATLAVSKAVSTGVSKSKSNIEKKIEKKMYPTAYIFAKTSNIKDIMKESKIKNNISKIKKILYNKGYIINSNDPLKMIMIGSKSDLSNMGSNAVNNTTNFLSRSSTVLDQIKKISSCTQTNITDINLILNNNSTILNNNSTILNNNSTILNNIKKIKTNEETNIELINNINKELEFNKNKNDKLLQKFGTSTFSDIKIIQNNIFNSKPNDADINIINSKPNDADINIIKNLVYVELAKIDEQAKTDKTLAKKQEDAISYMYIKYNNKVRNSNADIIFYISDNTNPTGTAN
jgi:hypothetical protein